MFPIRVFVYGTLKRGEPNEHHLTLTSGIQQFVGSGKTTTKFPLIVASKYNIPMILRERGFGKQICGEVYEIDEEKLRCLDQLEAYPELYTREIERIELDSGDVTDAWTYMIHQWRPDIYQESSELLENYSSKGSHGREYFDRERRALEILDTDWNILAWIKGKDLNDQMLKEKTREKAIYDLKTANE